MAGKPGKSAGRWLVAAAVLAGGGCMVALGLRAWHRRTVEHRLSRYGESIRRHAEAAGLSPELVWAVIRVESGGDPRAVSRTNARGLMQIMPPAEREALARLHADQGDLFDPDYNIRVGTAYLRQLFDRFDGDAYLALAAYNMGPTRVARMIQDHPGLTGRQLVEQFAPEVTRRYCRDILGNAEFGMRN